MNIKTKGFTLLEIVIVLAVVGGLFAVAMVGINSMKIKSRDSKRSINMQQIVLALNLFYRENHCLPITHQSTCPAAETYSQRDVHPVNEYVTYWDYSSMGGGFLTFLKDTGTIESVPLDPVNDMTSYMQTGKYTYRYFCYNAANSATLRGPALSYWKESEPWASAVVDVLTPATLPAESEYVCK